MSWIKLDDQIPRHDKIAQAGPAASWIWVCCIAHCQSQLTDGFVSETAMRVILTTACAADFETAHQSGRPIDDVYATIRALTERLIASKLLDSAECGYLVHDYLDHNPSKESVLRKRREDLERKGQFHADSTRIPIGIQPDSTRIPSASRGRARAPAPASHPIPSHPLQRESEEQILSVQSASKESVKANGNGNGHEKDLAPAFVGWFMQEYKTERHGAEYLVHAKNDLPIVRRLLQHHEFDHLKTLATIMLSEKCQDEFICGSDRGISILKTKINWLNERHASWRARIDRRGQS